ncbi:MAG: lysozyme inhibitor LprI family protein [Rhodospirillaceae bacterium]
MRLILLIIAVMMGAAPASASQNVQGGECRYRPSYSCALADDAISRTICTKIELMTADCAMGYAYRDARALPGVNLNGRLHKNQRAWIRQRDKACAEHLHVGRPGPGLAECLQTQTEKRLLWLIEHYKLTTTDKVYQPFARAKPQ